MCLKAATAPLPSKAVMCLGYCTCCEKRKDHELSSMQSHGNSLNSVFNSNGSSMTGSIGFTVATSLKGSPKTNACSRGLFAGSLPLYLQLSPENVYQDFAHTAIPDSDASEAVETLLNCFRRSAEQRGSNVAIHLASTAAPVHSLHLR